MVELSYYDSLYKILPFLHKSIGFLLAISLIFQVNWNLLSPSPRPLTAITSFERIAASFVHFGLYFMIATISVSGYLIPAADGSGISVFDLFEVTATQEK